MLIRLLPNPPHPSVLFNIIFDDLPDGLVLPQNWTTHLSNLMHDELPLPKYQHALDKASYLPCILEEVVFDVPALLVTCHFIDGSIEQWKVDHKDLGAKFLKTLDGVVDDVCLSTLETEREKQREKQKEKERERLKLLQQNSPSSSVKSGKHKKKRSLLMTIVSSLSSLNSIINLSLPSPTITTLSSSSHSPSSLHKSPSSPSMSNLRPSTPPPPSVCPRSLRRRARSSLVDAFRFYVLRELTERVPQGGYYVWILHSLLNEARQSRDALLARERERERVREQERLRLIGPPPPYLPQTPPSPSSLSCSSAGSGSPIMFGRGMSDPRHSSGAYRENEAFSATTSTEPPNSDDEEDFEALNRVHGRDGSDDTRESDGDTDTLETDTDGSSIQTPSSEHFTLPLSSGLSVTATSQNLPSLIISSHKSNFFNQMQSYPPSPTPTDLQIQNLTHLILLHTSHSARTAHDENTRLEALELRGRRRAWLNRALCPGGTRFVGSLGRRIRSNMHGMRIGVGASYSGLDFSVPLRRSTLAMWVVNAEDLEVGQTPSISTRTGSGQADAIMLEEEDVQLVGGERFSGYDERNGVEPRRHKVAVPSGGVQLLPVNEVEEDDEMYHHPSGTTSKSPDSAEQSDDDDNASLKFGNLELNQYDDLRELQMDLDIVTGVGFDMMDSSDEEDESDSHLPIPNGRGEGTVPEGGLRVAFDIPRPKALHARSAHLLSGQESRHQRLLGPSYDQTHPVHQYCLPDTLPERCHSPIPRLSIRDRLSHESPSTPSTVPAGSVSPGPILVPISVPQPVHSRNTSPSPLTYMASASNVPTNTIPTRPTNKDTFEPMCRPPSRAALRSLDSEFCTNSIKPELDSIPRDIRVNEMGQLVSRTGTVGLGGDDGEEFTLAMDLPSKLLSSRFRSMNFATMGQKGLKSRTRGASRLRSSHSEECMSVVREEVEGPAAWV